MTSETTITKTDRPQGLKMQELVAATGVPKSTILHYLNQGLLPAPVKTSRNMAYYDPACVERLTFIKMMQSKYRLPLKVIEKMLKEPQELRELLEQVEDASVIVKKRFFGRITARIEWNGGSE